MAVIENIVFVDGSGSMNGPVAPGSRMTKDVLAGQMLQILVNDFGQEVDSQAEDEVTPEGQSMGGLLSILYNNRATLIGAGHMRSIYPTVKPNVAEDHAGDLNTFNFERLWQTVQFGGGTYIMTAVRLAEKHYQEEFGDLPEDQKPIMGLPIITDGANQDNQDFLYWLKQPKNYRVYVTTVVVGYGQEHDKAVAAWKEVEATNPYVHVIEATAMTDAHALAAQLKSRME